MRCHNCKKEFSDRLNYCPYCGAEAGASARAEESIRRTGEGAEGVRRVSLNLSPDLFGAATAREEQPERAPAAAQPAVKPAAQPKEEPKAAAKAETVKPAAQPKEEPKAAAKAETVKPAAQPKKEPRAAAKAEAVKPAAQPKEEPRAAAKAEAVQPAVQPKEEPKTAAKAEAVKPAAQPKEEPRASVEAEAVKPLPTAPLASEQERPEKTAETPKAAAAKLTAAPADEAKGPAPTEESTKRFSQEEMRKIAAAEKEIRERQDRPDEPQVLIEADEEDAKEARAAARAERLAAFREKFGAFLAALAAALKKGAGAAKTFFKNLGGHLKTFGVKTGRRLSRGLKNFRTWLGERQASWQEKQAEKQRRQEEEAARRAAEQEEQARLAAEEAARLAEEAESAAASEADVFADDGYDYSEEAEDEAADFIPASTYYEYRDQAERERAEAALQDNRPETPARTGAEPYDRAADADSDERSALAGLLSRGGPGGYVDFREEQTAEDFPEDRYEEPAAAGRYSDFRNYEPPAERRRPAPRRHNYNEYDLYERGLSEGRGGRSEQPERSGEAASSARRDFREPLRYEAPSRYYYPEHGGRTNEPESASPSGRSERDYRAQEDSRDVSTPRRHPSSYGFGSSRPGPELYPGGRDGQERTPADEPAETVRGSGSFFTEDRPARETDSRSRETAPKRRRRPNPLRNAFEWLIIRLRPVHVIAVIIVIACIVGFYFIKNMGSPTKAFAEALAQRNYEAAAELYSDKYKGNSKLEASSEAEFSAYLNSLKQHALEGKSTYSATNAALDVIKTSALYTGKYKALVDETAEALVVLQQADVLFQSGKEKMNNLDFEEAIRDFNQVLDLYPGFPGTADLLATSRDRYREDVIRDVGVLQSQSKFKDAGNLIDYALRLIPNDPVLEDLKKNNDTKSVSALYQSTQNTAERYFQSGDFANVFKTIDEALAADPEDDSIKVLRTDYESKCAESILNTADSIFLQGDRDAAIAKLKEGLVLLPGNKLLEESISRYNLEGEGPTVPEEDETEPAETTEVSETETEEPLPEGDMVKDDLNRGSYKDAGGNERKNAVLESYEFAGDTTVVDQVIFPNDGTGERFSGVMALGPVEKYTQVYYQVYSSRNPASPLLVGSLFAQAGDDPGSRYKLTVDLPVYGADEFIVNLNYLQGGKIDVILDLHFSR